MFPSPVRDRAVNCRCHQMLVVIVYSVSDGSVTHTGPSWSPGKRPAHPPLTQQFGFSLAQGHMDHKCYKYTGPINRSRDDEWLMEDNNALTLCVLSVNVRAEPLPAELLLQTSADILFLLVTMVTFRASRYVGAGRCSAALIRTYGHREGSKSSGVM